MQSAFVVCLVMVDAAVFGLRSVMASALAVVVQSIETGSVHIHPIFQRRLIHLLLLEMLGCLLINVVILLFLIITELLPFFLFFVELELGRLLM